MNKDVKKTDEYIDKKKELNNKIDIENKRIALLKQLDSEFEEINKSFVTCIELFSTSLEGKEINALYDDILFNNREAMKNFNEMIDYDSNMLKSVVDEYNSKKEELEKDYDKKS